MKNLKQHTYIFIFFLLTCLVNNAWATNYTWTGSKDHNWADAANWSPLSVPTSTDNVTITSTGAYPELQANVTVNNLTVSGNTLDCNNDTLTVNGTGSYSGGTIKNGLLKLRSGTNTFSGTLIDIKVDAVISTVYLNGSTFNKKAYVEVTTVVPGTSNGGCTFNDTTEIYKSYSGGGIMKLANTTGNTYNAVVTFRNAGTVTFETTTSGGSKYNGNVIVESTGSGGINIGSASGGDTLASGKTISLGSGGFSGTLLLRNFTQSGTTSQSLTLSGANINLIACTFNGPLAFSGSSILLKQNTFNNTVSFTHSGSASASSDGGNVFNAAASFYNTGTSNSFRLGLTYNDTFNDNVTCTASSGGEVRLAYNDTTTVNKNVTFSGSVNSGYSGTGVLRFAGSNAQTFTVSSHNVYHILMDKTSGNVTMSGAMSILGSLTFVKGNIITTSGNLITMNHGSTTSGANNNSFVSGPIKKVGNASFVFPTGKGNSYRAVEISAPSVTNDAFTGEYFYDSQNRGSTKDSLINTLSNCDYWTLVRNTGTSTPSIKLHYDSTACGVGDSSKLLIANWNGTKWKNIGNGGITGSTYKGTVSNSSSVISYSYFLLASTASLQLTFTHTDQTYCGALGTASAIVTGGNGSYYYVWSNSATTSGITNLTYGTYTATVGERNGFLTATGSVNVDFLWPDFPPLFSGPTSACGDNGDYVYLLTNQSDFPANTVFTWSNDVNSTTVTGTSLNLSSFFSLPPTPGTSITLTATNNSCSLTSTVTFQSCCSLSISPLIELDDKSITEFKTLVGLGSLATIYDGATNINGPNILINGTFLYDEYFKFYNCNFYFGSGARILGEERTSTIAFNGRFENCSFQSGCYDALWQGIEINAGAQIQMFDCTVKDAYLSIWQRKPGIMNLNDTYFDNNYIALKLGFFGYYPQSGFPITSTYPPGLSNVEFHSTGSLLDAYPGLMPNPKMPGNHAYAGIYSEFVLGLDIWKNIRFGSTASNEKMNMGIYCLNGSLSVHTGGAPFTDNVQFANIKQENFYGTGVPNGCAIYCSGNPRKQQGELEVGGAYGYFNTFTNCNVGVYSQLMFDNTIYSNGVVNTGVGFSINRGYGTVTVVDNLMDVNSMGIELNNCSEYTVADATHTHAINLTYNGITVGNNTVQKPFAKGIKITELFGNTYDTDAYLEQNNVDLKYGLTGYDLANLVNVEGKANTVAMSDPALAYGFYLRNNNTVKLWCGSAESPSSVFGSGVPHYGFYSYRSKNQTLECNNLNYLFRGLYFDGNCFPQDIKGNCISNMDIGYYLTQSGKTGRQKLKGNMWLDPTSMIWAAQNLNGAVTFTSRVEIDKENALGVCGYLDPDYSSLTTTPINWFKAINGLTYECNSECSINLEPQARELEIDSLIALDSTLTSMFIDESKRMDKQDLYSFLRTDAALRDTNALFGDFYDTQENTNVQLIEDIRNKMCQMIADTSNLLVSTISMQRKMKAYMDSINHNDSLIIYGSLTYSDSLTAETKKLVWRDSIALLIPSALLQSDSLSNYNMEMTEQVNDLAAFAPEDTIEANLKLMYAAFINSIISENYTLSESDSLTATVIASLCPAAGGDAVITARLWLEMLGDETIYDDASCNDSPSPRFAAPAPAILSASSGENNVKLIPNPASTLVNVEYNIVSDASLSIYSLSGQLKYQCNLDAKKHYLSINVSSFQPGVYEVKTTSDKNVHQTKLVILH